MKKLYIGLIVLVCASFAFGQAVNNNNITAASTDCSVSGSCVTLNLPTTAGGATITLGPKGSAFSATVQFELSGDGGTTYYAVNGTTPSGIVASSGTAVNTWQFNVSGYTQLRARASTFSAGPLNVNIQSSSSSARGPAGGGAFVSGLVPGEPVVSVSSSQASSSPVTIDAYATQALNFPNDACAAINAAINYAQNTANPKVNVIDARGFSGNVPCNSSIYHGQNVPVEILLDPKTVFVTQVPQFLPYVGFKFTAPIAGNSGAQNGISFAACGPDAPSGVSYDTVNRKCTFSYLGATRTVNQFPGQIPLSAITGDGISTRTATCTALASGTTCGMFSVNQFVVIQGSALAADNGYQKLLSVTPTTITWSGSSASAGGAAGTVVTGKIFNFAHGPLIANTYYPVFWIGSQGTVEGEGDEHDAQPWDIFGVAALCGSNSNCISFYTENSDENTILEHSRWGFLGASSAFSAIANQGDGVSRVATCSSTCNGFHLGDKITVAGSGVSTDNAIQTLTGVTASSLTWLGTQGGAGGAGATGIGYSAGFAVDRPEAPTNQPGNGPARIMAKNINMAGGNQPITNTGSIGALVEGENISVVFTQGSCTTMPRAWVTSVGGGNITTTQVDVHNNGTSACNTTPPTCTFVGAPPTFGLAFASYPAGNTCTVVLNGSNQVASLTVGGGASYASSFLTGSAIFDSIDIAGQSGSILNGEGVVIDGVVNAVVQGHLHCINQSGYCEHTGAYAAVQAAKVDEVDSSGTAGSVDLGFGTQAWDIGPVWAGGGNLVNDEIAGTVQDVATFGKFIPGYKEYLTISPGTGTNNPNVPAIKVSDTWNNASIAGPLMKFSLTNTSSAGTSLFFDFECGSGGVTPCLQLDTAGDLLSRASYIGTLAATNLLFSAGISTSATNGAVGGAIFKGSDDSSNGASVTAGYGIFRGGINSNATPNAAALEGVVQLGSGFLKTTVANVGDVVCGTTTAFTVTDCSHTGPQVNIVGIANTTANPIGVVASGQALVKTDGAVTIGDTLCMGTTTDGLAHDSGGQGACATAGASIGVVIAVSGTITQMSGITTAATAMSTTLPLVQLHLGK